MGFLVDLSILQGVLEISIDHTGSHVNELWILPFKKAFNAVDPVGIPFISALP